MLGSGSKGIGSVGSGGHLSKGPTGSSSGTQGHSGHYIHQGHIGSGFLSGARGVNYTRGYFFKALFTGRLRAHNSRDLLLMFAGGLMLASPALCSIAELVSGYPPTLLSTPVIAVIFGVLAVMGVALLVNFALSVRNR